MKRTRKYFTLTDLHSAFVKDIDSTLTVESIFTILKKNGIRKAGEDLMGIEVYDGKDWAIVWNLLWIHYRKTYKHVFDVQPILPPPLPVQKRAIWIS
jgi:hypothetical protein